VAEANETFLAVLHQQEERVVVGDGHSQHSNFRVGLALDQEKRGLGCNRCLEEGAGVMVDQA